ncbi:MAG: hypothetical protein A2166_02585 [Omnitrophica WOR_2 bacterium RBG_13_41_10]|nr:MAG: hypothetical protein A2166_02585 [Omnitrophica WOR_2 bacterium RBG_13_41_10]
MQDYNLDTKDLRKFGITMGIAFAVITFFILFRHKQGIFATLSVSILFFIFAFIMTNLLKPVYILWMKLAFILGWINTRLILIIMFYLVLTPMSIVLRLLGKDLLDRKIDKNRDSYWHKKEAKVFNVSDYERQF